MKKILMLLLLLPFLCGAQNMREAPSEKNEVYPFLGTWYNMYVANRMPYTDILCEGGRHFSLKGTFIIDYGSDTTVVDTMGFAGGWLYHADHAQYALTFINDALTSGPYQPPVCYEQKFDGIHANGIRQSGMISTDILSQLIVTLDYTYARMYIVWDKTKQCLPDSMVKHGFLAASTAHYFSNDRSTVITKDKSNNPTVPVVIGDKTDSIKAVSLIDPGFNDKIHLQNKYDVNYTHLININRAFFDQLKSKGMVKAIDRTQYYTLSNRTSTPDTLFLCSFKKRYVFYVNGTKGEKIMPYGTDECNVFLKVNGKGGASAGGITIFDYPAAQFGGSFLIDCEQVTFDPFKSLIWVRSVRRFQP